MEFHEFAKLFPLLEGEEFLQLVNSIRKNGQRETIKVFGGKILDGRNRYRACNELGIKPQLCFLSPDTNALEYVLDANLHRRHLTNNERAFVAASAANLCRGRPKSNKDAEKINPPIGGFNPAKPPMTTDELSKKLDVPTRTIQKAKHVQDKGVPELRDAVLEDEITLNDADKIALLPKEQQPDAIQETKTQRLEKKREQKKQPEPEPEQEPRQKPEPARNGNIRSVAIARAAEAVNCLMRIPKNDPKRERGFQIVTDWIKRSKK
jgi:ParB-like chromosome segregation protein Spo0J